ncbi:hypothetical protein SBA5_430026 [Candidatus Sulfotelmatomonas gaucii]|uniref:Uncharacterized protein n=1 Tax=Candidatus Sulfuritelmatomonas gaucii TaxID=2043161 RepID=A0A2N9LLN3_9BACT|nr:hypothetical protein SBA5_430026 [Candidatus Sulfotelmatomonas gaucii]
MHESSSGIKGEITIRKKFEDRAFISDGLAYSSGRSALSGVHQGGIFRAQAGSTFYS